MRWEKVIESLTNLAEQSDALSKMMDHDEQDMFRSHSLIFAALADALEQGLKTDA